MAVNPGGGVPQNAQFGPKPLFGGLWGRSNAGYYGQNGSSSAPYENNGPNYNVPYGTAPIQAPQAPYNPEYPSQYAPHRVVPLLTLEVAISLTLLHQNHHLRHIQLDKITPSSVVSVPNASIPNITLNN
ncbi:hypothetical protein BDZ97DRAFT_290611 [Flammula alnicola]|nr:hypothetical protein BDZ97DRAFT_290611 [Flammula alnicola]